MTDFSIVRTIATVTLTLSMLLAGSMGESYNTPALVAHAQPQTNTQHFPETSHTVKGRFLDHWQKNGGLSQQGYPLTEEMQEVSPTDGKTYIVQYFERAVFELHPENRPTNDVLLSLLGVFEYTRKYGTSGAPDQRASTTDAIFFKETGRTLGGTFRSYWEAHGGLPQQGYPISDEFREKSDLNGKVYTVQYFERGVFELHPENTPPHNVLLSQLGTFRYRAKYIAPGVVIPIPREHASRLRAVASDKYVVWEYGTGDIFGHDLRGNKAIEVSRNEPFEQLSVEISGSTLVYQSFNDTRHEAPTDIIVKDLDTGAESKIATSTAAYIYPKIAGKRVVWAENLQLLLKEPDNGVVKQIASPVPDSRTSIQEHPISSEYVVWSEIAYFDGRYDKPRPSYLKSYNLNTGEVKTVAQFEAPATGPRPVYALAGHTLVIYEPLTRGSHRVIDLNTGETTPIAWKDGCCRLFEWPLLSGDMVVWSTYQGDRQGLNIWGMDLKGGNPIPLVIGEGDQLGVALVGGNLVWVDKNEAGKPGIGTTPLGLLVITAPDRQKALEQELANP